MFVLVFRVKIFLFCLDSEPEHLPMCAAIVASSEFLVINCMLMSGTCIYCSPWVDRFLSLSSQSFSLYVKHFAIQQTASSLVLHVSQYSNWVVSISAIMPFKYVCPERSRYIALVTFHSSFLQQSPSLNFGIDSCILFVVFELSTICDIMYYCLTPPTHTFSRTNSLNNIFLYMRLHLPLIYTELFHLPLILILQAILSNYHNNNTLNLSNSWER